MNSPKKKLTKKRNNDYCKAIAAYWENGKKLQKQNDREKNVLLFLKF
jgi:hypothetical protein